MHRAGLRLLALIFCLASIPAFGQAFNDTPARPATAARSQKKATPAAESPEQRTARYFDSIKSQPSLLYAFLHEMPKGADLHNHLTGSVYAESYIQYAIDANLCLDRATLRSATLPCKDDQVEVRQALTDPVLYRRLIDAWSMRGWPWSQKSGHDHFFDTFGLFNAALSGRYGDMLAELARRNADGNVQYLELMFSPDDGAAIGIGAKVGWNDNFATMREKMLAGGLRDTTAAARKNIDALEARRDELMHCRDANKSRAEAGCAVTMRYQFQVLRGFGREQVFAQILAAFELATADPRVVALNLVMPEDALVPMRDFRLHMRMISYLKELYPNIHVALHAGELAPGLVPPDGLRFHIRDSVEVGRAERIGHGVDVMYEDDPFALLNDLAKKNIMVEINLTSNDAILGIKGKQHPLAMYMKYGVPVAISTDDEGVARSEMTREYQKAVEEQGLDYLTLKKMARTSLEHAFLPGASLWSDAKKFVIVKECAADKPSAKLLSANCQKVIDGSQKAREQWKLERSLAEFESFKSKTAAELKAELAADYKKWLNCIVVGPGESPTISCDK
jgi:adenosine deaminase